MFSKKSKEVKSLKRNLISENTQFEGDVISDGDIRIDGRVKGNIKAKGRVLIGKDGLIKGNIECANADIEGGFIGTISVLETLSLKSTADISGEVFVGKLSVEPNAILNASCTIKGTVKELINEKAKTA